MAIKKGGR
ncbi:hypothetical protein HU200_029590 [Digitaria exilis]|uniref:Uncharacterized protein n=1 Tax=Digitaria exilis TaxID=1010633 RepID=A0A835BSP8_9POAL|nr:hypothetical protein HU200_029590 [Digitaria exilis]